MNRAPAMKAVVALLALGAMAGCSGEPEPTVGDVPIAKGMVRQPPRPIKPPPARPGAPRPL